LLLFPSQLEQGEKRSVVCTPITEGAALRGADAGLETRGPADVEAVSGGRLTLGTGRGRTGVGGENRKG